MAIIRSIGGRDCSRVCDLRPALVFFMFRGSLRVGLGVKPEDTRSFWRIGEAPVVLDGGGVIRVNDYFWVFEFRGRLRWSGEPVRFFRVLAAGAAGQQHQQENGAQRLHVTWRQTITTGGGN